MTAFRALRRSIERWADALTDPAHRERAMPILLGAYAAIWTIYGTIAKSSQDLHADMTEIAAWSRELAFGYTKHPPLAPYLTRAWFSVFPAADWSFYLFGIAIAALTLWIAWRIALRYLNARKALAATLLLTFIPFFNFHALKFNANTVLMPVWAATTLWFLISFETRSRLYAVLAGIGAAAAMLGKYWSVFLLLGLGVAALIDRRRWDYFRSGAPYLTIVSGALVLAPHVVWLFRNDFAPLRYATTLHAAKPFGDALIAALGYLVGSLGYAAIAIALVALFFRPDTDAVRDTFLPRDRKRRFIWLIFALPLVLPAIIAPLTGTTLNSVWSMSGWTLLGVVLLSSPAVSVTKRALTQLFALALILPLVLAAAGPAIAYLVQRNVEPWQTHTKLLAAETARLWSETTPEPLRVVCGDAGLVYGVEFYSASRPMACADLGGFASGELRYDASLARDGMAIVCFDTPLCGVVADRLSGSVAGSKRRAVMLSRTFMGREGPSVRYLIVAIPPQK